MQALRENQVLDYSGEGFIPESNWFLVFAQTTSSFQHSETKRFCQPLQKIGFKHSLQPKIDSKRKVIDVLSNNLNIKGET